MNNFINLHFLLNIIFFCPFRKVKHKRAFYVCANVGWKLTIKKWF